jgi:predicted RNA-binding Zn ribbon-like protein
MVKSAAFGRGHDILVPRELVAHQVGGHLALDFCNTAGEHLADRPNEMLHDWESFLRWAVQVVLIGSESYFELLRHPEPIASIVRLREAIYRVGIAVARAGRPSERDLAFIREHANRLQPEIRFRKNAIRWRPTPSRASSASCAVLAREALSLLCSPNALRIRICEGGQCGWLFLDGSRGKRRRWCDMNDCGNRAKARRYYDSHKGS